MKTKSVLSIIICGIVIFFSVIIQHTYAQSGTEAAKAYGIDESNVPQKVQIKQSPIKGFKMIYNVSLGKGFKWDFAPSESKKSYSITTNQDNIVIGLGNIDDLWDSLKVEKNKEIIVLIEIQGSESSSPLECFVNDSLVWRYNGEAPGIKIGNTFNLNEYVRSPKISVSQIIGDKEIFSFHLTARASQFGLGYIVNNFIILGR